MSIIRVLFLVNFTDWNKINFRFEFEIQSFSHLK